jgi:AraC family transcriptional regulator
MIAERPQGILNSGNNFGRRCFQLKNAPSVLVGSAPNEQMAITRITVPKGLSEPATPGRPERAFTIGVHLRQQPETREWGTWVDGKFLPIRNCERGAVGIYDLEASPIAVRPTGFDSVHFNLPRRTLDAFTDHNELHRIGDLPCTQGIRDDVMLQLTRFALPWLGDERRVCSLMFDYFVWMFCSHIAASYGQVGPTRPIDLGGLAPWQKRCLMELIDSNLEGKLRLSYLAEECGLSVSHFCRSFKRSFGVPVHRYLITRRVERAKFLLRSSSAPLSEIALESGFADQAAFSRSFRAVVGTSPMRWLNEHIHRLPVDLQPAMRIAREGIHGRFLSPIASQPALDDRNEGARSKASR